MTATPPLIADPPEPDLVSELLRSVRLTGSVFLDGRFSAPFGVVSPKRWDENMGRLRHVSVFHLIGEGACTIETPDGARHDLNEGDLILIPFTPEHRISHGDPDEFVFGPDAARTGRHPGVHEVAIGGGGAETRLVCGFLESAELLPSPLFRTLPQTIVERRGEASSAVSAAVDAVLRVLNEPPSPGGPVLLGRLMEVLFVEVMRRHISRLPADGRGVLAASRDPVVGRALTLLHADPARAWAVEDLAVEAGASRSVLGERFNRLLGAPPIEYLARLRMQIAADRLRTTPRSIAQIAEDVGYESEAAFSRAFRRIVGESPGAWRDAAAA